MGIENRAATPQDAREAIDQAVAGTEITISSLVQGYESERKIGRYLDLISTNIPGFYALVATGDEAPDMLRSEVEAHAMDVRIYYLRDLVIKRLQILQEPLHNRFVQRALENEGLRGGQDVNLGGEVQLNPNQIIEPFLVQEKLGERAGEYIHQKTVISFELDPETNDVERIYKAVKGLLKRRGLDPEKVERINSIRIDREDLFKAVKNGEITLLPGTIKVSKEPKDWKVKPRTIATLPEVEEAVRRAAESLGLNNPEELEEYRGE